MGQTAPKLTRVVAGKPIFVTDAGVLRRFTLSAGSGGAFSNIETFRADAVAAVVQVIGTMMNEVQAIEKSQTCREIWNAQQEDVYQYQATVGSVTITATASIVIGGANLFPAHAHKSFRAIERRELRQLGKALVHNLTTCRPDMTGCVCVFNANNMNAANHPTMLDLDEAPDYPSIMTLCPDLFAP